MASHIKKDLLLALFAGAAITHIGLSAGKVIREWAGWDNAIEVPKDCQAFQGSSFNILGRDPTLENVSAVIVCEHKSQVRVNPEGSSILFVSPTFKKK